MAQAQVPVAPPPLHSASATSSSTGKKVIGPNDPGYASANFASGAMAGLVSTILSNPFEALRTRMSSDLQATGAADKRFLTNIKYLFKDGFVSGMRVGLAANLITSVPSNAVYLPAYNFAKEWQIKHYGYDPKWTPLTGAVCGVLTTNATLSPFFVTRTRAQLDTTGASTWKITKSIYKESGPKGFYRGLVVNASGRIVEEGLFWAIYENMKLYTTGSSTMQVSGQNSAGQQVSLLASMSAVLGLSMFAKLIGVGLAFPYNAVMNHLRCVNKVTGKHDHTKVLPTIGYIYKNYGISGFYNGLAPQVVRSLISKSSQILVFELAISKYCEYRGVERPNASK